MKQRAFLVLLLLLCVIVMAVPAFADGTEPTEPQETVTEIYTVTELQAMAENPLGSYVLMADLDMAGVEWKPFTFKGKFDGNGHAILNLTLSQPGEETGIAYDGNETGYSTQFMGLFGILREATVKNLQLINVRALVETDEACFIGGIAGSCDNSLISGCTVTGTLELRAHKDIYGVGGVAGYGLGSIEGCKVDVTLITVDTDATTKAEQFLGGVYATGFIDSKSNVVTIDGYISEVGYVHSGGITGLYMQQPLGRGLSGRITDNVVEGQITFFEHNSDRRAYCSAYAGETLAVAYLRNGNQQTFKRNEIWTYDKELRPCTCEPASCTEVYTEPTCNTFGFSTMTCDTCGYTYTDKYTLKSHTVSDWLVVEKPTVEKTGMSLGHCSLCGAEQRREEPKLEVVPTEATEPMVPPVTEPVVVAKPKVQLNWQLPVMGGGFVLLLILAFGLGKANRKNKKK